MSDVRLVQPQTNPRRRRLPRRGLWIAHNSGRFDTPSNLWRHAIIWLRGKADLITGTEAASRSDTLFSAALGDSDWAYAHLTGAAAGECFATWNPAVVDLLGKPFAHKLTDLTWVRDQEHGGKEAAKVHALVLRLRITATGKRLWLVVVHMPLDNTPTRAAAWLDCCVGLAALKADLQRRDPTADVLINGDWNKNLRLHNEAGIVRQRLEKPLGLVTSWEFGLPKTGGTHGTQVIDYGLLRRALLVACELLRDLPDSDHRAMRYRIRRR